jgi:succinoglycan biosynthesis transport protein ExoP
VSKQDEPMQPITRVEAAPLRAVDPAAALFGPAAEPARREGESGTVPFRPRMMLRYKWSILGIFIVCSGVALVGIWSVLVPKYKATATIEVSPVIRQLLEAKGDVVPLYESYRRSQVDHITGYKVLNAVLDRKPVQRTSWYRADPTSLADKALNRMGLWQPAPPLDRLSTELLALAPRGTQTIYVSMWAATPGEPKLIVDAVVEEYMRFANQRTSESELELMGALRKQIKDRELEMDGLEARAAEVRRRLGTDSPEQLREQRLLRLDELIWKLRQLNMELDVAVQTAAATAAEGQPEDANEPEVAFEQDPGWRRLHDSLMTARQRMATAPKQFSEMHPTMVQMREAVAFARQELEDYEASLSSIGPIAGTAAQQLDRMKVEVKVLEDLVAEQTTAFNSVFEDTEKLKRIDAEILAHQGILGKLRGELERMEMNRQVPGQISATVARELSQPDDDKRLKLSAAALAGSFMLALLVALLRVRLSPQVEELTDVVSPSQSLLLGRLPLRDRREGGNLVRCPIQAEYVRIIRTALLGRLEASRHSVVQVTSATVGAGKSTLAAMLGRSLAQCGKRVLLVDGDVRRPALEAHFGLERGVGLMNLLLGGITLEEAIRSTDVPGLELLPAGMAQRTEDLELMANGRFSALLAKWREDYDIVLLDSTPMLGLADAPILARHVDGTVMVVRERHCRREDLRDALTALNTAGGRLLGTVFVGSGRLGAYGGYGYGAGYGYTHELIAQSKGGSDATGSLDVRRE